MAKTKSGSGLQVRRSGELRGQGGYSILLYGANGSGKTFQASTWPKPLWLVPRIGVNELRTIEDYDLPFLVFESIEDLAEKIAALREELKAHPGLYKTLVFDSLTTTQTMFEDELKQRSRVDKLEWSDWGRFTSTFVHLMSSLHSWPLHKIWICHTDGEKIFSLKGDSRQLFPNNADIILYCESRDAGGRTEYRVHPRRCGQWPARVRRSAGFDDSGIPIMGPDPSPSYDMLAPFLGLRSCAEEEQD
jgi:hypothetical protein